MGDDAAALLALVAARFEDASSDVRDESAAELRRASEVLPPSTVCSVIAPWLTHARAEVRQAAVSALSTLVEHSYGEAVAGAVRAAGDSKQTVREIAARLLGQLGRENSNGPGCTEADKEGQAAAVVAVGECVLHSRWEVRAAACFALSRLARKETAGDVTAMVVPLLSDSSEEVRKAACRTVGCVASTTSNAAAIAALVVASASEMTGVGKAAAPLLRELHVKATAQIVAAITALLRDNRWDVRFAALFALRKLAEKGDKVAIAAALTSLSDECHQVREGAVDTLRHLATKSDKTVTPALVALLTDDWSSVQVKALRALSDLVEPRSNHSVISLIREHLNDDRPNVRAFALRALRKLAKKNDAQTLSLVSDCVTDKEFKIRWEAMMALRVLASTGDKDLIASIKQMKSQNESWTVHFFLIWALWELTEVGYGSTQGDLIAIMFSVIFGSVLCSFLWSNAIDVSPPYRPAEPPSGIWWVISIVAHLMAAWALWKLCAKGYGSGSGTIVGTISVVSFGLYFRG